MNQKSLSNITVPATSKTVTSMTAQTEGQVQKTTLPEEKDGVWQEGRETEDSENAEPEERGASF